MKSENKPGAVIIEGHIQGLSNTRSLGEAGIPVYVVDKTNCIARYSKYCKKFFRCPDFIKDEFVDFLVELAESEKIHGWALIPSNDHAVINISRNRKKLEKHYKIITPGIEIIENIYDKSELLNLALKNGISIPDTYYFKAALDEIPGNVKFPLLTKGRYGLSFYRTTGRKALIAENATKLRQQLSYISDIYNIHDTFCQELIPSDGTNNTISFTAFCTEGSVKAFWMGEKLREHPIRFGTATFARSIYEKECHRQSVILLKALNYTGVCEVEFLRDPRNGKFKMIEMNARTWLWVELAKRSGVDYAKILYNYVNDYAFKYPSDYLRSINWSNYPVDIVYSMAAILRRKLGLGEFLRSYRGEVVNAIYDKRDKRPALMYVFLILNFLKNR